MAKEVIQGLTVFALARTREPAEAVRNVVSIGSMTGSASAGGLRFEAMNPSKNGGTSWIWFVTFSKATPDRRVDVRRATP